MSATVQPQSDVLAASRADAKKQLSRRVLVDALFLGGIADALLHNGPGVGLFLWMIVFAFVLHDLVRRRGEHMTREQRAWLGAALSFTVFFAWRDSSDLGAYNFLAMLGALTLLGATLSRVSPMRTILGQRLRDVALAIGRVIRNGAMGVVPLTF